MLFFRKQGDYMKRVPVYISVEEMAIIREGLEKIHYSLKDPRAVLKNRLDNVLEEEIDRNTEPTGGSDEQ
jgi:hypothetical protein